MKELRLCETEVSLRGALNQTSEAQMDALVAEALRGVGGESGFVCPPDASKAKHRR